MLPAHAQASSCSQVIRTITFDTANFGTENVYVSEPFNGDSMDELLACNTRLSFAWDGDDSPNQLVALNLYYSGGTTTFKAIQPNTSSPATFTDQALWNNGVVYQGVNIYDGSSSSSIPFDPYSWNVGTMTLTIS